MKEGPIDLGMGEEVAVLEESPGTVGSGHVATEPRRRGHGGLDGVEHTIDRRPVDRAMDVDDAITTKAGDLIG
jgi:hypothetical protein